MDVTFRLTKKDSTPIVFALVIIFSIVSHVRLLMSSSLTTESKLQLRQFSDIPPDFVPHDPSHHRTVSFLCQDNDWSTVTEAYSGMWWQSLEGFLSIEWVGFTRLEDASFFAFANKRVLKTKDWLDFSVTHLSILWKHFEKQQDEKDAVAFTQLEKYLDEFVANAKPLPVSEESAAPDTIAVLPFFASPVEHTIQDKALLITLVSLWESGIARCVVVCGMPHGSEQAEGRRIETMLTQSLGKKLKQRAMEFEFIILSEMTPQEQKFMPQTALRRLDLAFKNKLSAEETKQWLGADERPQRRWKFVYFSEPDLVLHARPSVMKALKEKMEAGYTLSGHRFDVVAHEDNFPGYQRPDKVVPRIFVPLPPEIDIFNENLSCCDAGKYYPANLWYSKIQGGVRCGRWGGRDREFWWNCGFRNKEANYSDIQTLNRLHARLGPYPLLRFQGRLPFPLVDEHQRVCNFLADGRNCAQQTAQ